MSNSVQKILTKTNQQVTLVEDDKKMNFAESMSGWAGWRKAWFGGGFTVNEFSTMIQGKQLIAEKKSEKH